MVNSLKWSKGNLPTDRPDGIYTLCTGAFILTSKPYTLSDSNFVTSCLVETKHKTFFFFSVFSKILCLCLLIGFEVLMVGCTTPDAIMKINKKGSRK